MGIHCLSRDWGPMQQSACVATHCCPGPDPELTAFPLGCQLRQPTQTLPHCEALFGPQFPTKMRGWTEHGGDPSTSDSDSAQQDSARTSGRGEPEAAPLSSWPAAPGWDGARSTGLDTPGPSLALPGQPCWGARFSCDQPVCLPRARCCLFSLFKIWVR